MCLQVSSFKVLFPLQPAHRTLAAGQTMPRYTAEAYFRVHGSVRPTFRAELGSSFAAACRVMGRVPCLAAGPVCAPHTDAYCCRHCC